MSLIIDVGMRISLILGLLTGLSVVVLSLVWVERKFLGRIQMRMGPMVVGPYGLLQPVADAIKLVAKEDLLSPWVDRIVYWVAPLAVFIPSFMIWVTIPISRDIVIRNMDMGLFYIIAFSVLSIVGLVAAGWASSNKYAVLGGFRAAAQLISYEIPLIMAVLGVAMLAQSLNLQEIVNQQDTYVYALVQPLGLLIFFIAGLAEIGRTPFDIHPAESEVVGGPFVEYSGAHWSIFFLAEYINTFAIAALTVLLFLGGWLLPGLSGGAITTVGIFVFFAKTYLVILIIFWFRGTYPRLRIDQLMSFGWKMLVPLSFGNIILTGFYMFYGWPTWLMSIISITILVSVFWLVSKRMNNTKKEYTVHLYKPESSEVKNAG
ncbi:MAG: NADH-quinone oxidoreductase subunit NuoH [Dehalococcoidia bacterium]|nr:NADH-quinone oxidoreductase subunit NuoH [Dehalococcoidia bacterium]